MTDKAGMWFPARVNVLSETKKQQVVALGRLEWPLRRIEAETGVRRETASAYLKEAGVATRAPRTRRPPKPASQAEVSTDPAAPKPASQAEVSTDQAVDERRGSTGVRWMRGDGNVPPIATVRSAP